MNASLSGAREARPSWLGRLVARAGARELRAFVVPGPDVSRALGLDIEAAGLPVSDTPRHASVLVLVGEVPASLKNAASVAYAQMPRPRAILALGTDDVSPLPGPDVSAPLGQEAVVNAVAELRRSFAEGAFAPEADAFDVEAVRTETGYVCSMHPEVVRGEPGSCPICGMDLVPREAVGGGMDHGGMDHDTHDHMGAGHGYGSHGEEEAGSGDVPEEHDEGGSGGHDHDDHRSMNHEHEGGEHAAHEGVDHVGHEGHGDDSGGHGSMDHANMGHEHMDHDEMDFMSMVAMTEGTPRSSDGLQMEWVEASFGPLFPGLPASLALTFTLDGDTVASTEVEGGIAGRAPKTPEGPLDGFAERLARANPLSPVAYRLLALRAVEDAAGIAPDRRTVLARVGALERERAASHLGWLASFGHLIGDAWISRRAGELQLAVLRAIDVDEASRLRGDVGKFVRRVNRTPLLERRLRGIGSLGPDCAAGAFGPVARACGGVDDVRAGEPVYRELGFEPDAPGGDDSLGRLRLRLAEAESSLGLATAAGSIAAPNALAATATSGTGTATVETPRGAATLSVALEGGMVLITKLDTPSTGHLRLIRSVTEGKELSDALVGVASLDISPWEVTP